MLNAATQCYLHSNTINADVRYEFVFEIEPNHLVYGFFKVRRFKRSDLQSVKLAGSRH